MTTTKLAHLKNYDVVLLYENTTALAINGESKNLPTDVHLIRYRDDDNQLKLDAVRSYKMSDIFDGYYDYGIKTIESIESGFGSIKPKLYNPNPGNTEKKDKK